MAYIEHLKAQIINTNEGAAVREPIINIMRLVTSDGPDARTFRGKGAKDYVSADELTEKIKVIEKKIMKLDNPVWVVDSSITGEERMNIAAIPNMEIVEENTQNEERGDYLITSKGILALIGDLSIMPKA